MSPKSLSAEEKNIQREKLLRKGAELLSAYGIRKTSIDDITKAANMAKGTFYQHFESKEHFFFELLVQYHNSWFQKAEEFLMQPGDMPIQERVRVIISGIFNSPYFMSIFKYHYEIEELMQCMVSTSKQQVTALADMEYEAYKKLLEMVQIDTSKIKAGVVHNYIHAMYFGMANYELMIKDCLEDTFKALLEGLILYIFGG